MFENITLEISLKPFKKTDENYIREICALVFRQWAALLQGRKRISILLWAADGSEILEYDGNVDKEFEWARFIGTANMPYLEEGAPRETSLHARKQDYIENAPKMTYSILKSVIAHFKAEGKKLFPDAEIRVGETFDIGPEFAISDFKYRRHKEIISGNCVGLGFVDSTAKLHADNVAYAAYPDGIPEGTPFGTFLGKQSEIFLKDMGFDYLWLSNGLGFSADPWDKTGKIYDGEKFYPEKLAKTKAKVFEFWKLFRDACPDIPVETRGTNNSVGIDYATDGVPLYDIYNADFGITAPPNSPWAAINDDFGLEIMGHMTRIAELPSDVFPFRYYIHDPWWVNSPWYDRYNGTPCDIYLPMAISKITSDGKIQTANSLNLLSIDNSYGGMPDSCVNEPLPHLLKSEKDAADAPAPLVWVYPFREYTTSDDAALLKEMYSCDNFIAAAVNDGFPLCCVTSTNSFLKHNADLYADSTIVTPVPENAAVLEKLTEFTQKGIGVIMYGGSEKLNSVADFENLLKVDTSEEPAALRQAWSKFGYDIKFIKKNAAAKAPAVTVHRHNNALFVSVCNSDTTTDALMKFPYGAPVLCGAETEITGGCSSYRFSISEHRECRVFVNQAGGVVSCREAAPVSARFRRAIKIKGLKDATVTLFGEKGCECAVSKAELTDFGPIYDDRFETVKCENGAVCLKGEHIDGDIYFLMGKKGSI